MPLEPIAATGASDLFPGSTGTADLWRYALAGTDLLGDVPASDWPIDENCDPGPEAPDPTYPRCGGLIASEGDADESPTSPTPGGEGLLVPVVPGPSERPALNRPGGLLPIDYLNSMLGFASPPAEADHLDHLSRHYAHNIYFAGERPLAEFDRGRRGVSKQSGRHDVGVTS